MLYDYLGQPTHTSDLKKAKAAPAETGPRKWNFSSVASSLTPAKLASIFKDADQGRLQPLLTLAGELECRDAHARAQLQTRKLALAALEWRVEALTDSKKDVALAEELQQLVDGPLWRPAVIDAMDGINKPFSAPRSTGARGRSGRSPGSPGGTSVTSSWTRPTGTRCGCAPRPSPRRARTSRLGSS